MRIGCRGRYVLYLGAIFLFSSLDSNLLDRMGDGCTRGAHVFFSPRSRGFDEWRSNWKVLERWSAVTKFACHDRTSDPSFMSTPFIYVWLTNAFYIKLILHFFPPLLFISTIIYIYMFGINFIFTIILKNHRYVHDFLNFTSAKFFHRSSSLNLYY